MTISPTQDDVMKALRAFLLDRLAGGVEVKQGIVNRVAEPTAPNFVVMTLIRANRLATNRDVDQDVRFAGSIAAGAASFAGSIAKAPRTPGAMPFGLMTVSSVAAGAVTVGGLVAGAGVSADTYVTDQLDGPPGGAGVYAVSRAQEVLPGALTASWGLLTVTAVGLGMVRKGANVFGVGVMGGTTVRSFGTGAGGVGTYVLSPSQVVGPGTLSAGGRAIRQNSQWTVQLDFHSADPTVAPDMAQTISTTFRDPYAVAFFADLSGGTISPLFADDPRFAAFQNENQQFEYRWIVEANLQVNQTTVVPAEYADLASVEVISVDAAYPP